MSAVTEKQKAWNEARKQLRAMYGGENRRLAEGSYDKSLAVKCVNGTFVGRKTENIIAYRGIPFVGAQPVGSLRWKAPVDVTADDGVYEVHALTVGAAEGLRSGDMQKKVAWLYGEPYEFTMLEGKD